MAQQSIQINVRQESSGTGVSVSSSLTSDGTMVKKTRQYFRQGGGYTIDSSMHDRIVRDVLDLVQTIMLQESLF